MTDRDRLRIGDAERDQAARALGEHFAQGRLDNAEHDDRLTAIWRAKTAGDIRPVFDDLPGPAPAFLAPPAPRPGPFGYTGPPGMPQTPTPYRSGPPMPPPRRDGQVGRVVAAIVLGVIAIAALKWFGFVVLAVVLWIVLARSNRRRHPGPYPPHGPHGGPGHGSHGGPGAWR